MADIININKDKKYYRLYFDDNTIKEYARTPIPTNPVEKDLLALCNLIFKYIGSEVKE
jgi:hypothetical protein